MALSVHQWHGPGRWLSFVIAALLLFTAIPMIFVEELGAVAGWNIFLGLLLFGAIVSGNKRAPILAIVVAALLAVRLVLGALAGMGLVDLVIAFAMFGLMAAAAYDLRRQALQAVRR